MMDTRRLPGNACKLGRPASKPRPIRQAGATWTPRSSPARAPTRRDSIPPHRKARQQGEAPPRWLLRQAYPIPRSWTIPGRIRFSTVRPLLYPRRNRDQGTMTPSCPPSFDHTISFSVPAQGESHGHPQPLAAGRHRQPTATAVASRLRHLCLLPATERPPVRRG